MQPSRFDDLTKALATATSRRQALKTITATTIGGILGLAGIGTAFADQCKPLGASCFKDQQCCSGLCTSHTKGGGGTCVTPCAAGLIRLSNGSCAAPCSGPEFSPCGSCGTVGGLSCGQCRRDISGSFYCENNCGPFIGGCTSDSNCDTGYFCYADPGVNGACAQLCSS